MGGSVEDPLVPTVPGVDVGRMVGGAGLPRLPLLPPHGLVPALPGEEVPACPAGLCAVLLLVLVRRLRGHPRE